MIHQLADAVHDHWRKSSPEVHYLLGTTGFVGWMASVNWSAVLSFVCLAAVSLIGTGIELYRRWELVKIELDVRRKQADETPPLAPPEPPPLPRLLTGSESAK